MWDFSRHSLFFNVKVSGWGPCTLFESRIEDPYGQLSWCRYVFPRWQSTSQAKRPIGYSITPHLRLIVYSVGPRDWVDSSSLEFRFISFDWTTWKRWLASHAWWWMMDTMDLSSELEDLFRSGGIGNDWDWGMSALVIPRHYNNSRWKSGKNISMEEWPCG
jgi:hypothetical protein